MLPIYVKPISGFGTQNHQVMKKLSDLEAFSNNYSDFIFTELLNGEEFTIECFTTHEHNLIYANPRKRTRVRMGTSLSFTRADFYIRTEFFEIANALSELFKITGPWYFQIKFSSNDSTSAISKILEVSTRLAGSSVWSRANGVNLSEIALWDYKKVNVSILENNSDIVLERELESKMSLVNNYSHVYIDLDNTILFDGVINYWAIAFLIQEKNNRKKIHLITKSLEVNLNEFLTNIGILFLFDTVIHLKMSEEKSNFIAENNAIFIDDSFTERSKVNSSLGIPCFGPDVIPLMVK
jgi:hypothetical protein